jgi:hypothetical protein
VLHGMAKWLYIYRERERERESLYCFWRRMRYKDDRTIQDHHSIIYTTSMTTATTTVRDVCDHVILKPQLQYI